MAESVQKEFVVAERIRKEVMDMKAAEDATFTIKLKLYRESAAHRLQGLAAESPCISGARLVS